MKNLLKLKWDKKTGLLPAIIQDEISGVVLMLGYMNKPALQKTIETDKVWFYSRSKKRLWMKGEKSKNSLKPVAINYDCDCDTLLLKVIPVGPTCHTGQTSCFFDNNYAGVIGELFDVIEARKNEAGKSSKPKKSYTVSLFNKGLGKICEKIKEESGEVILAARKESKKRIIEESVDLLYHLFVALVAKKIGYKDFIEEIKRRRLLE